MPIRFYKRYIYIGYFLYNTLDAAIENEKMGSEFMYLGMNAVGSTIPDSYRHPKQTYTYEEMTVKAVLPPRSESNQENSNAVMEDSEDYQPIECWFDKPHVCRIGACSEMEDLSYQSLVENESGVPWKQFPDELSSCSLSYWK